MDFEIEYDNDSTSNYLVLRPKIDKAIISYQSQMLLNNKIDGMLDFNLNYIKNRWNCYYDVTSKYTLENFLVRKKFSRDEFLITLRMIINNIFNIRNYLLYDNNILLDERYIYVEPESMAIYFIYLPFADCKNDLKAFFTNLIAKLIKFQNEDSDNYIQKILEVIKSDLFNLSNLKQLIENLLGEDIKNNIVITNKEIKTENVNTDKVEKVKNSKQQITKGIVKIPNLRGDNKQNNREIKLSNKKIDIALIGLQPIILIAFILTAASNIVKMSNNPKTTILILLLIFISLDVLVIRIINEKKKKSNDVDQYKPLQFIVDKMKGIGNNKELLIDNKYDKEYDLEVPNESYRGETVILKKEKPEGIPYLKEKDGEEVIKIDKESVLIGRMENFVDYIINSNAIGKIHAEIMNERGTFYVMDCNSRNGTFINGVRIVPNTKVKVNTSDELRFANKEFIFVY